MISWDKRYAYHGILETSPRPVNTTTERGNDQAPTFAEEPRGGCHNVAGTLRVPSHPARSPPACVAGSRHYPIPFRLNRGRAFTLDHGRSHVCVAEPSYMLMQVCPALMDWTVFLVLFAVLYGAGKRSFSGLQCAGSAASVNWRTW